MNRPFQFSDKCHYIVKESEGKSLNFEDEDNLQKRSMITPKL